MENYLRGLAHTLGADRSACEVARVLRLPGSENRKDPARSLPIAIIECDHARQYNLSDFQSFLDIPASTSPTSKNPTGWIAEALSTLADGNRNATFARIVGRLHRDGWTSEDILALLKPHAQATGFPERELEQEVAGICQRYSHPDNSGSATQAEESDAGPKRTKATLLLNLVEAEQVVLFHDQFDEPHVVLPEAPGEVLKMRSKAFRR